MALSFDRYAGYGAAGAAIRLPRGVARPLYVRRGGIRSIASSRFGVFVLGRLFAWEPSDSQPSVVSGQSEGRCGANMAMERQTKQKDQQEHIPL